ncbi:MAG: peptide-binding protein [Nitrospinae bacterium]|nr:peptide-binding protein [Nitrospinota bacterium]
MRIRRILFALPILVGASFLLAFLVARGNFDRRINQLVVSSIGDAEKLNPILLTDASSSFIAGLVFNGLVKYDETQKHLIGELAHHWTVTQKTFVYLDPSAGLTSTDAAERLGAHLGREGRATYKVEGIEPIGPTSLVVHLATAGKAIEKPLLAALPSGAVAPITLVTVRLDTRAALPDGAPLSSNILGSRLKKSLEEKPLRAGRLLELDPEHSGRLILKVLGPAELTVERVEGLIATLTKDAGRPPDKPVGSVINREVLVADHRPSITFFLRDGVRWHDGAPFSAEDVKFTYEKLMDERTQTVRRPNFELVSSVEVIDPLTVRVTYKRPYAPSLEAWGIGIIPKHLLADDPDINTASFNRRPIGTGAFKFYEWVSDEQITVVANEDYWEGRPLLDRIAFRIIPEAALKELEFMTSEVDQDNPQPHQYARIAADERFRVFRRVGNGYTYIGWNLTNPLFADRKVRRALTHAINREEIIEYILHGLGVIATGPFPPQMWYANNDIRPLAYDPALAKRLLAEAGWRDTDGDGILDKDGRPFRFRLITNNGNVARQNVTVLVQRQLREVGIDVEILLYEWSVFISRKINPRDFEACVLGWSLGLDPDIYEIWHSSQGEKGFNFVGYDNPAVDRLIEEGRTEYDQATRTRIYRKIHRLIHEDQPYTFLFVGEGTPALHRGAFKLLETAPDGRELLRPIDMPKAGLFYHLIRWMRTTGPVLTPS